MHQHTLRYISGARTYLQRLITTRPLRTLTCLMILLGAVLNLSFILPNGDYSCYNAQCGLRIGEWHYHDALWHIAVARNSFSSFPPIFPSASGYLLTSYNYLLGVILLVLERLSIDPLVSYFKILPVVGNIALAYALVRYFKITRKDDITKLWIIFFTYFGASFSYLLILYRGNFADFSILKGFPVVASLQPGFVLSNIQFFLTVPIFVYVLTDVVSGRRMSYRLAVVYSILLMITIGLKIYSAPFIIALMMFQLIRSTRSSRDVIPHLVSLVLFILSSLVALTVFYLVGSKSSQLPFALSPLAIPHAITESPGLFYSQSFTLGRYFMYGLGRLSPRLIGYEILSALFFVIWNLGSRLIVLPWSIHLYLHQRMRLEIMILSLLGLVGLLLPIFFIQRGTGWYNTIQFSYMSIYTLGIVAGISVADLWKSRLWLVRLGILILFLATLPNNILQARLITKGQILISREELTALSYLRTLPKGVVLSFPDVKNSSYVPALSANIGYMIDFEQSALLSLPVQSRIDAVDRRDCAVLDEVQYVYLNGNKGREFLACSRFADTFRSVFTLGAVSVYQKVPN